MFTGGKQHPKTQHQEKVLLVSTFGLSLFGMEIMGKSHILTTTKLFLGVQFLPAMFLVAKCKFSASNSLMPFDLFFPQLAHTFLFCPPSKNKFFQSATFIPLQLGHPVELTPEPHIIFKGHTTPYNFVKSSLGSISSSPKL